MYFIHEVPGRLRVKIAYLKNNPYRLKLVRKMLAVHGVFKIRTSTLTGSIVVEYDPMTVESAQLLDILRTNGYAVDKARRFDDPRRIEQDKILLSVGKATLSWVTGKVLEANGLSYIAAFI